MNFEGTRTIEFVVSKDNYNSAVETMLRSFKLINDNEDILEWDGIVFTDLPLKLKIKQRKAVETIDYGT